MKLQFDSSQEYQLAAIRAVVDIFEGQPLAKGDFELSFALEGSSLTLSEKGVGNRLVLNEEQLLQNVRAVQERNSIALSGALERCQYTANVRQQFSIYSIYGLWSLMRDRGRTMAT